MRHNGFMQAPRPNRLLSPWDLAALAGLLALACLFAQVSKQLPERMPIHFDALGRANGWAPKAQLPWLAFGAPAFLWAMLFLIGAAVSRMPTEAGRSQAAVIQPLRGMLGLGLCLVMAGVMLAPFQGSTALFAGLAGLGICLVLGIVFTVRDAWQSLAGLPDSEHYRGGVFYVNPRDPRLWVPKRIGVGWTLNYARPAAFWVTLLMLLAIPALFLAVQAAIRR
jgi:uncharacterized membrane protein